MSDTSFAQRNQTSNAPSLVTILGSTGSIGQSTLSVIADNAERFSVFALTANTDVDTIFAQCKQFRPAFAVMVDPASATELQQAVASTNLPTKVLSGAEALTEVAADPASSMVMAAIVGAAGLRPTLAAVRAGKKVLLANKEALVMSGPIFMREVRESGATLLPIDSEHNAIFQCLPSGYSNPDEAGVEKIFLTGSGGPFLSEPLGALAGKTPAEACAHPNWEMGRKISVDSATMMNKGLELIEACLLFDVTPQQVQIVIHPQSIIHSMVAYNDGSVLAQMGNPDMRTPIAHAMAWPERVSSGVAALDPLTISALEFCEPESARFPCLGLAQRAITLPGSAPAVLNAANEVAVAAFLAGELGFTEIARVIDATMKASVFIEPTQLSEVITADEESRSIAMDIIANTSSAAGSLSQHG